MLEFEEVSKNNIREILDYLKVFKGYNLIKDLETFFIMSKYYKFIGLNKISKTLYSKIIRVNPPSYNWFSYYWSSRNINRFLYFANFGLTLFYEDEHYNLLCIHFSDDLAIPFQVSINPNFESLLKSMIHHKLSYEDFKILLSFLDKSS